MASSRKSCCYSCCCCCSHCFYLWICRRCRRPSNADDLKDVPMPEMNIRVIALYDFEGRYDDDLIFKQKDRLIVIEKPDAHWWKARHSQTGEVGIIPSSFVRRLDPKPENHEAWYHVVRREAMFLLSNSGPNSYLLRPYANDDAECTLSVCVTDSAGSLVYKHYKVMMDPDGTYRFCSLSQNKDFFQLIDDHKEPVHCHCGTVLTTHCIDKIGQIIRGFQTSRAKLKIDYRIGEGNFGEVWHGFFDGMEVAVKTMKADRIPTPQIVQDFMEEARKMCQLKHPNVVQLLGVCMDDGPMLLVMEYLKRGPLQQYLRDDAGHCVTYGRLCNMLAMVSDGMDYVGSTLKIVHRDLRAANVLVAENLTVKVADFGLARDTHYFPSTFQLPIRWTAPEAFYAEGHSIKADVWSFGVLIYEVLTYGWVPYSDMTKDEVRVAVAEGYRLPNPHGRKIVGGSRAIECSEEIYNKMLECWNIDPTKRPAFDLLTTFFYNSAGMEDIEYLNVESIH